MGLVASAQRPGYNRLALERDHLGRWGERPTGSEGGFAVGRRFVA